MMTRSPEDSLRREFASYYLADEFTVQTPDDILRIARDSAEHLSYQAPPHAIQAIINVLRSAARDPSHPVTHMIWKETLVDWDGYPAFPNLLSRVLTAIADSLETRLHAT